MSQRSGRFLRDNSFLIAAISLPLVVVAFFLVSSIVPRWLVAPPTYDLLLRTDGAYDPAAPRMTVDYTVRDGALEATVRPVAATSYLAPPALFLFDHETLTVRRVPVMLPRDVGENDPPRAIVVEALVGRRVVAESTAPDGYRFEMRTRRGMGVVGGIFGMNRFDPGAVLVKSGRVVPLTFPLQYQYFNVQAIGWLDEGRR